MPKAEHMLLINYISKLLCLIFMRLIWCVVFEIVVIILFIVHFFLFIFILVFVVAVIFKVVIGRILLFSSSFSLIVTPSEPLFSLLKVKLVFEIAYVTYLSFFSPFFVSLSDVASCFHEIYFSGLDPKARRMQLNRGVFRISTNCSTNLTSDIASVNAIIVVVFKVFGAFKIFFVDFFAAFRMSESVFKSFCFTAHQSSGITVFSILTVLVFANTLRVSLITDITVTKHFVWFAIAFRFPDSISSESPFIVGLWQAATKFTAAPATITSTVTPIFTAFRTVKVRRISIDVIIPPTHNFDSWVQFFSISSWTINNESNVKTLEKEFSH